jgi:hypothetical protein
MGLGEKREASPFPSISLQTRNGNQLILCGYSPDTSGGVPFCSQLELELRTKLIFQISNASLKQNGPNSDCLGLLSSPQV